MLKHMLSSTNGNIVNRLPSNPVTILNQSNPNHRLQQHHQSDSMMTTPVFSTSLLMDQQPSSPSSVIRRLAENSINSNRYRTPNHYSHNSGNNSNRLLIGINQPHQQHSSSSSSAYPLVNTSNNIYHHPIMNPINNKNSIYSNLPLPFTGTNTNNNNASSCYAKQISNEDLCVLNNTNNNSVKNTNTNHQRNKTICNNNSSNVHHGNNNTKSMEEEKSQYNNNSNNHHNNVNFISNGSSTSGVKEMLISLGLLCLVSLLLALLSLIFLLKISPVTVSDVRELLRAEQLTVITAEEYVVVYEATLALCALTLSLNLCCLLVCAIQFLFAVKLVKSPYEGKDRTSTYLKKASMSRTCAVGGFFISIPIFLTGIIMYTFIQFHSTPAIVTSVFIGVGIIFCGCAMVHNVFIWQREKTNAVKELRLRQQHQINTTSTILNGEQQSRFNSTSILDRTNNTNNTILIPTPLQTNHNNNNYAHFNNTIMSSTCTTNGNHINNNTNNNNNNTNNLSHTTQNSNSYLLRPSSTTSPPPPPPPPPPPNGDVLNLNKSIIHPLQQISGSTSPNVSNTAGTIDLNSVGTTNSHHELSTLV